MRLEWLFIVALVLYTSVIWIHQFKKKLTLLLVVLFGLGLLADLSGTVFLCALSAKSLKLTAHNVSGFVSLLIMALHFAWAVAALRRQAHTEARFNRYSVYAWAIWLFAFISGIPA